MVCARQPERRTPSTGDARGSQAGIFDQRLVEMDPHRITDMIPVDVLAMEGELALIVRQCCVWLQIFTTNNADNIVG